MSTSDKQWEFLQDVARLILFAANFEGYKLTGGELYRTKEQAELNAAKGSGIVNSLHRSRLAIDLMLFINNEYITTSAEYYTLGEYWKSLNPKNRWGGDFPRPDGNHFERTK